MKTLIPRNGWWWDKCIKRLISVRSLWHWYSRRHVSEAAHQVWRQKYLCFNAKHFLIIFVSYKSLLVARAGWWLTQFIFNVIFDRRTIIRVLLLNLNNFLSLLIRMSQECLSPQIERTMKYSNEQWWGSKSSIFICRLDYGFTKNIWTWRILNYGTAKIFI